MNLEEKNINALRMLAIDMIENAGSGHPGIALGCAPTMYTLYSKVLNVVPNDDKNILRDRFVLSAGHGSSIYYAMLHAFGYKISIDDLKNFRKLGSITPGHSEYGIVPGVDATTGPLGQGVSMAVGMALAEKMMASRFNKADISLFDNYTYTLVGEGCLMEGVSFEALSLAGSLKLNKLIVLYDCNNVTLDGKINTVMDMNILSYMKSLHFNTLEVQDGNDVEQIYQAIMLAKQCKDKPSFIKINTHIGFGSVHEDSNKAHGSILGSENVKLLKEKLGVTSEPFTLDKDVARDLVFLNKRFVNVEKNFKERMKTYAKAYPGDYKLLQSYLKQDYSKLLENIEELNISKEMSGRDMGGLVLNEITKLYPQIITGSADLFSSTKAVINSSDYANDNFTARNIKFGIREFAMGCVSNGIALYGGMVPFNSTFLVFSDYMKASLRLGAIMKAKSISVFTHDSIAVGEDGTTHQPVEQISTLRQIPNMQVFRPCNLTEIKCSYAQSLEYDGPSSIILSRQTLKNIASNIDEALCGGYIISPEQKGELNGVIIATGSEVELAISVQQNLLNKGYNLRVVSMPCIEIFEKQSEKYKNKILPDIKSTFSIEAGSTNIWYKYTGRYGKCFGVDDFGESAKPKELYEKFGLTENNISNEILKILKKNREKTLSIY